MPTIIEPTMSELAADVAAAPAEQPQRPEAPPAWVADFCGVAGGGGTGSRLVVSGPHSVAADPAAVRGLFDERMIQTLAALSDESAALAQLRRLVLQRDSTARQITDGEAELAEVSASAEARLRAGQPSDSVERRQIALRSKLETLRGRHRTLVALASEQRAKVEAEVYGRVSGELAAADADLRARLRESLTAISDAVRPLLKAHLELQAAHDAVSEAQGLGYSGPASLEQRHLARAARRWRFEVPK